MKRSNLHAVGLFILVFAVILAACSTPATAAPTNTPRPTITNTVTNTVVPTKTLVPTNTPRPTATPNLAVTQRYNDMFTLVQQFNEKDYIASMEGRYIGLKDFTATMSQIDYYQWYPTGRVATNFIFSAHFKWSTATKTPNLSGCGIVFALQDNSDHYAVFLDKSTLLFLRSDSTGTHRVGKTRGSDAYKYDNPDEADSILVVDQDHAYVLMDDNEAVVYTLAKSAILRGELALTLASATNKDYGTRCEMTNVNIWVAE